MTVSATAPRNDYTGNDLVDTYSYNFRVLDKSHLRVTQEDTLGIATTLTVDVDFTVTGVGSFSGGDITLTAGVLPDQEKLTIRRVVPVEQQTDLRNQGGYYPETVEDMADYITYAAQQFADELTRSLRLPESETSVADLPAIANRKNRYLAFDDAGDPVAVTNIDGIQVPAWAETFLSQVDNTAGLDNLGGTRIHRGVCFGTGDSMGVTVTPAISSYEEGDLYIVEAPNQNTLTNPTITMNGLAAKTIVKNGNDPLQAGDVFYVGHRLILQYDSVNDNFELLNPRTNDHYKATGGGTADAITATSAPFTVSYLEGQIYIVEATGANTVTNPTINLNSLGARTIVKNGNQALVAGDISGAGHRLMLQYDSGNSNFELLNPAAAGGGGGDTFCTVNRIASGFNVANSSNTQLPYTNEMSDLEGAHDNVTNPERITVPAGVSFARPSFQQTFTFTSASGTISAGIYLNGASAYGCPSESVTVSAGTVSRHKACGGWIPVTPGDYFSIWCFHNLGVNAAMYHAVGANFFTVEFKA